MKKVTLKVCVLSIIALINLNLYAEVTFQRNVENIEYKQIKRIKQVPRTLVFPRSQLKYGLFQNYLHYWIDRPLFLDRSMRAPNGVYNATEIKSFLKEIDIVKSYGVDGLAYITTTPGQYRNYIEADKWLNEAKVKNFLEIPEFYFVGKMDETKYQMYKGTLETALKSKYSVRINGKVLISSYAADRSWTPAQIKSLLDRLRREVSKDFLFVPQLTTTNYKMHSLYHNFKIRDKKVPEKYTEEYEVGFQKYLDTFDGIYFDPNAKERNVDGQYPTQFDSQYIKDYFLPMLQRLMAKKQNQEKLLVMYASIGYINHLSSVTYGEFGTSTLRNSLSTAIAADPDFIIIPEWDEVNENTCIQPTVYNSLSSQRILKYYMQKLKGLKPVPNEGDDLSIPNMVISYRRVLKLGEPVRIELLNIPDAESSKQYTVQLILKSVDGRVLCKMPQDKFTVGEMNAVVYKVPSEQLTQYNAVVPELTVVNSAGKKIKFDNLLYVKINTTWCNNYKTVKQPLRDALLPANAAFTLNKNKDSFDIKANVDANEKLASVEVLENGDEAYAVDLKNEFELDKNILVKCTMTTPQRHFISGKLYIRNVSRFKFRNSDGVNMGFKYFTIDKDGVTFNGEQSITCAPRSIYIAISKDDADNAVLDFDLKFGKFKVAVKDIIQQGVYAQALPKKIFFRFDRVDWLPDSPVRIHKNSVSLSCNLKPVHKFPIYHIRAITESGKTYRSKPIIPVVPAKAETTVNIFSETAGKVITVNVPKELIPDLNYIFNPDCGQMIRCSYGRVWDGELGGGYLYAQPFWKNNLTGKADYTAPEWEKINSQWILKFDGIGTNLTFPKEALPCGSFTLEFDMKPASKNPQVLFRHYGTYIGSLTVMLKNSKLYCTYSSRDTSTTEFDTGLPVVIGQWNKIQISYNMKELIYKVNNETKAYKFSGKPLYFMPSTFGGHTKIGFGIKEQMNFFKGDLRKFRIIHKAEKIEPESVE